MNFGLKIIPILLTQTWRKGLAKLEKKKSSKGSFTNRNKATTAGRKMLRFFTWWLTNPKFVTERPSSKLGICYRKFKVYKKISSFYMKRFENIRWISRLSYEPIISPMALNHTTNSIDKESNTGTTQKYSDLSQSAISRI